MATYVMDIEANGLSLDVTKIWCVVLKDIHTSEVSVYYDKEALKVKLKADDKLILHNGIMYDLPVLEKLWGIKYKVNQVYDTLLMSRVLEPDRNGGHSLEAWGKRVGIPKIEYNEFNNPDINKLVDYCKGDVEITQKIYNKLQESSLTGEFIRLEHQFAYLIQKQIEAGFAFDEAYANDLYLKYSMEFELYRSQLLLEMPRVEDTTHYKSVVEKGALISESEDTYTYLCRNKVVTKDRKYIEPNPTSRQQIADYLISKGWKPTVFTETGLPKVDESSLKGVKGAEGIIRMFTLQKKMGMLKDGQYGWLNCVRNGRIHGDVITNGANTGRCTHSKPNVAQTDGDPDMRRCWIAGEGKVLVGVDAASLEFRTFAHYLAPYDDGNISKMIQSGADVHETNKVLFNLDSRGAAKTLLYAGMYAGSALRLGQALKEFYNYSDEYILGLYSYDPTIVKLVDAIFKIKKLGSPRELDYAIASFGSPYRDTLYTSFPQIIDLIDNIKETLRVRGYLLGIDGRPLRARSAHSAFSLLNQSAGAVVMKQALVNSFKILLDRGYKLGVHYNYVGNIHDEVIIECIAGIEEDVRSSVIRAIVKAGEDFKLKCPMNGEGKIGKDWSETH